MKTAQQKIVVDPANPAIAYCGMPYNSGNPAGAYTTLNKAGGSTLATWTSVKTSGSTPIPITANPSFRPGSGLGISAGLAIDATSGTTTIGGQTVTNRIIIPIAGSGIYESLDGGNTFTEVAASGAIGTGDFYVSSGGFTAEGVYYCILTHITLGGIWRYKSGVWLKISSGIGGYVSGDYYQGSAFLIIDPRNTTSAKAYLSMYGKNGFGIGYTSLNANGVTPTWTGSTSGQAAMLLAAPYDIGYINYIFGQGPGAYTYAVGAHIDLNGVCWWPGNQSLFYVGSSSSSSTPLVGGAPVYAATANKRAIGNTSGVSTTLTVTTDPTYGAPTGIAAGMTISAKGLIGGLTIASQTSGTAGGPGVYVMSGAAQLTNAEVMFNGFITYCWSMGRGMEVTVAEDALCPPGGTYPVLAVQDLGSPMRGTLTTYPADMYARNLEYTCEGVEYAANDPSLIVARVTDQGAYFEDVSGYSPNYGADGSWVRFAGNPTSLWQAQITASKSNGSGSAGFILDVTAVASGTIFPYAQITGTVLGGGAYHGRVQPYGTSGTTGVGNTGTYYMDTSTLAASGTLYSVTPIQGGQTVAVDIDHYVTCPAGLASITLGQWVIPAYSGDRGATWQLCTGLPEGGYVPRPWSFGSCCRPFAVGYGPDLNTVWAALRKNGLLYLYRSTDKGANFSPTPIATPWTVSDANAAIYCLSVPGKPGELWISGNFTGGGTARVWHITNANSASATVEYVNLPPGVTLPLLFTMGKEAPGAPYPALYLRAWDPNGVDKTKYLYEGTYPGTGLVVNWVKHGLTGSLADLPHTCQLYGFASVRGDWNTYRRLYATSGGCGLAYYDPG
jgi:hypothetical protein